MASRFNLGFALYLNTRQFKAGMREAASSIKELTETQKRQQKQTEVAHDRMVRAGISAGVYFMALKNIYSAFKSLSRAAAEYDYQARALNALMNKGSGEGHKMYLAFKRLNPQIREFAPKDVIARMLDLTRAGFSQNEVLRDTGALLETVTAAAGTLTSQQAVEMGINLQRAFGDASTGMQSLFDTAFKGTNMFSMNMNDVATSMGYVSQNAVTLQQSMSEMVIALGMLKPITKTASKAGTGLRNALNNILKPETVAYLKKWGVEVKSASGKFRPILDVYAEIEEKLAVIRKEDKQQGTYKAEQIMRKIAGIRGMSVFTGIQRLPQTVTARGMFEGGTFESPKAALFALRTGLADASGETKRLADAMKQSSVVIEQQFNRALNEAGVVIGNITMPLLDEFHKHMTALLDTLVISQSRLESEKGPPFWAELGSSFIVKGIIAAAPALIGVATVRALRFLTSFGGSLGAKTAGFGEFIPGVALGGRFVSRTGQPVTNLIGRPTRTPGGRLGGITGAGAVRIGHEHPMAAELGMQRGQTATIRRGGYGPFGHTPAWSRFLQYQATNVGATYEEGLIPYVEKSGSKLKKLGSIVGNLFGPMTFLTSSLIGLVVSVKTAATAIFDYGKQVRDRLQEDHKKTIKALKFLEELAFGKGKRFQDYAAAEAGGYAPDVYRGLAMFKRGKTFQYVAERLAKDRMAVLRKNMEGASEAQIKELRKGWGVFRKQYTDFWDAAIEAHAGKQGMFSWDLKALKREVMLEAAVGTSRGDIYHEETKPYTRSAADPRGFIYALRRSLAAWTGSQGKFDAAWQERGLLQRQFTMDRWMHPGYHATDAEAQKAALAATLDHAAAIRESTETTRALVREFIEAKRKSVFGQFFAPEGE